MRFFTGIFLLTLTLSLRGAEIHFNFSDTPAGAMPTNFMAVLSGTGSPGEWKIVTADVPSQFAAFPGQAPVMTHHGVLAQTSVDPTDERFPMILYTGEKFRNFKFTTRFKILSGVAEQMAGVVFRYQNSSNYYVVRASALGRNVRFYKVVDGLRSDPIGPELEVTTNAWHSLAVQCEGTQISIWFDGKLAMPALGDNSLSEGLLGYRTKSDAVAYFDDASVEYTPIIPGAQLVVNKTIEKETKLLGLRIYTAQTNGTTRVIASKDMAEIGQAGTEAELKALTDGTVWFAREKGTVLVTLPLHDRNGEFIAAVRVKLKSFFGETQDNAITRARMIVKDMQEQITSEKDLE
jgi:hypothetical protein